jgi:hypothetical protein
MVGRGTLGRATALKVLSNRHSDADTSCMEYVV